MNAYDKIDIADVLYRILRRWKLILCFGVLLCACLIGYKVYRNQQYNASLEQTSDSTANKSVEDTLSEDDKSMVYVVFEEYEQLCVLLETQKNDSYGDLNAYDLNVLSITYRLDLTEDARTSLCYELEHAYILRANNYVSSVASRNYLVWAKGSYMPDTVTLNVQEDNRSSLVFVINVAGADSEQTSKLADEVKRDFEEYNKILSDEVCGHNLNILEEKTGYIHNEELALDQYNLMSRINILQTNINSLKGKFTEEQMEFYEQLCGKTIAGSDEAMDTASKQPLALTSGIVKYGVAGLFAGVFAVCAWIIVVYVIDGHLKTSEEFAQRYGLIVLETFEGLATDIDRKKMFVVDRMIHKFKNKGGYTLDVKKGMLCSNLKKLCKENDITELGFAATMPLTDSEREFLMSVTEQLGRMGLKIIVCDNVLKNLSSFEQMSELKKVVLVEKTTVSRINSIEQYIKICKLQNIQVLGGIIL